MQTSHTSIFGTLLHVYQADAIWLKRHEGIPNAKLDEELAADLATLRHKASEVQGRLIAYAGALTDDRWSSNLDYRFMSGLEASSPVYDNLLHVVNHGTYHRGQIVTLLRQLGASPIVTDYVHYVRTMTGA